MVGGGQRKGAHDSASLLSKSQCCVWSVFGSISVVEVKVFFPSFFALLCLLQSCSYVVKVFFVTFVSGFWPVLSNEALLYIPCELYRFVLRPVVVPATFLFSLRPFGNRVLELARQHTFFGRQAVLF